jgi:hypothetical protein
MPRVRTTACFYAEMGRRKHMTTRTGMQALIPLSLALAFVGGLSAMAETVGPVTDELGVVEVPAGEPLPIGSYLMLTDR